MSIERPAMKTDHSVWSDWKQHIISFQEIPGYSRMVFASYEELFYFVAQKGLNGFRIR